MKLNKKIALAALCVVLSAMAYVNINSVQSIELTDLQLENLEALAKCDDVPRFLCCNSLPGCCDYGDFEADGDWAA